MTTVSIGRICAELLPWELSSPAEFADATLKSPEHTGLVAELQSAAFATRDEKRLEEFRDIAKAQNADESQRLNSILSRAQSLFVALAIFSALFSFGTALLSTSTASPHRSSAIYLILVIIIVMQMLLMVANIGRTIGGVTYPRVGTSDLTSWLRESSTEGFYRAQAILELNHYRQASLNNTWRFQQLTNALKAFRNIVVSISTLILAIFFVSTEGHVAETTLTIPATSNSVHETTRSNSTVSPVYQILWWAYPAEAWQAWFDLGLIFAGIGGTLVVGWQSYLLRKQVAIGRAEFVATHRPKLIIAACKLTFEDVAGDHTHHCAFTYRNEGISPAYIREIGTRVFSWSGPWTAGDREIRFDLPERITEKVLSGTERRYVTRTRTFNWDRKNEGNWYFAGYIEYSDSAVDGAIRKVGFLRRWNAESMSWDREPNEQYEYSY